MAISARRPVLWISLWFSVLATIASAGVGPTADAQVMPPDPTPPARVTLRARTDLHSWEHRRLDGGVMRSRAVRQQFDLAWRAVDRRGTGVFGIVSGSFVFDEALAARPPQPLLRETQLQPELQRAYVRWGVGPALSLRLGRHDLVDGGYFARIDGASARLRVGRWQLSGAAGLRPDDGLVRIDGWAYLPDTDRERRSEFGDHDALFDGRVAYDDRHGGVSVGVRHERSVDRDFSDGTHIDLAARVGEREGAHLSVRGRAHAQYAHLDQLDARAVAPIAGDWSLSFEEARSAPLFPADSVFSVFPITEYASERLTAQLRADWGSVALGATHETTRPVGEPRDERTRMGGGHVRARWHDRSGGVTLDGALDAAGGNGGDRFRASAGTAWVSPVGPTFHLRQTVATQRLERSALDRRTGVYATAAMTGTAGDKVDLGFRTVVGWDTRNRANTRVLATADVSLSGRR